MRRLAGLLACSILLLPAGASGRSAGPPPRLADISIANGSSPFAGDGQLLTTVSPNGDGFRDRAIVSFRLDRRATVKMEAIRTDLVHAGRPSANVIWFRAVELGAGKHRLAWTPSRKTSPRTYVLRLRATDARGGVRVYGNARPGGPARAPVVRVQGIDVGFPLRSYAQGERADVSLATDARTLDLQVFAYSRTSREGAEDYRTSGLAMTPPLRVDWSGHRNGPGLLRFVRAGEWPSGLYFLRAKALDGRVGYAPLIVRPRVPGRSRIAVVLATNTWQAYNFLDGDGDGWGDSWYVSGALRHVDLRRPYLDFGLPFRFKDWDLTFIAWLNRTGKHVEFLSDDDLDRFRSGDRLASTYDLVVFPGHEEYVTAHTYDVVERYRKLGGNLIFLAANNFFWKVRREGGRLERVQLWRKLGRPEARLVGAQYVGSDHGSRQAPYRVTGADKAPWLFAGTGLANGDSLGSSYGIEIDARTRDSPPGTLLLAQIPNLMGAGRSAEMTYYETTAGAKVFAAGTINFAATLERPDVSQLVENLWTRLSRP